MIVQLRAVIDQLRRRGGPASFSKFKAKNNPKRAGRKPGQGTFRNRNAPEQSPPVEAVAVPVNGCCSDCGCAVWRSSHRDGPGHRYSAGATSRSKKLCNRDTPAFRVWQIGARHTHRCCGRPAWPDSAPARSTREGPGACNALRARSSGPKGAGHNGRSDWHPPDAGRDHAACDGADRRRNRRALCAPARPDTKGTCKSHRRHGLGGRKAGLPDGLRGHWLFTTSGTDTGAMKSGN